MSDFIKKSNFYTDEKTHMHEITFWKMVIKSSIHNMLLSVHHSLLWIENVS